MRIYTSSHAAQRTAVKKETNQNTLYFVNFLFTSTIMLLI